MKKIVKIISILLAVVVSALCLTACAPGAPKHDVTKENYVLSEDALKNELDAFVTGRENRRSFTDEEKAAAQYLQERLIALGYADAAIEDFTSTENNKTQTSQNVWATYTSPDATDYVVLGAYYDNFYGMSLDGGKTEITGSGALANATGVATLIGIADYLATEKPTLGCNVIVVFFGASAVNTTGAEEFYKQMDKNVRSNTILMVELQRLGTDYVYAYSDTRPTEREKLFTRVAEQNKFDIYSVTQKSPLITNYSALNGSTAYQWAHTGLFREFFNRGIPTLNLVGANWETVDLTDTESANNSNIAISSEDTLKNLKSYYPDYAAKMSLAGSFVIKSLSDAEFVSTMRHDKTYFPDTSVAAKTWIWYLVVIGILGLCAVAMTVVNNLIIKKYPLILEQPKNIKMAVFGMDYEDPDPDNVFIEFKHPDESDEEIFPGVPNNDARSPFSAFFSADEKDRNAGTGSPLNADDKRDENPNAFDPFDENKKTDVPNSDVTGKGDVNDKADGENNASAGKSEVGNDNGKDHEEENKK